MTAYSTCNGLVGKEYEDVDDFDDFVPFLCTRMPILYIIFIICKSIHLTLSTVNKERKKERNGYGCAFHLEDSGGVVIEFPI